MITFTRNRLRAVFNRFSGKKILVIGDVMLDRYFWGSVTRISPEAPVPVVDIDSESSSLGGAANVSDNVRSLGALAIPIGVVGEDASGHALTELFKEKGFPTDGIVADASRPTTVKTRIIAHHQHVVRTDREVRNAISKNVQQKLLSVIQHRMPESDGVILEDYNKGLLAPPFIRQIVHLAEENGKPVFVDPKFDHFFEYGRVTLFKPNRKEASDKLGMRLDSDEALQTAGTKLLDTLHCSAVLITLGSEGMALFEPGKPWMKVPTRAVKVHDVSGAGDTVIAVMAVAVAAGANFREAATIANQAAGLVCGEVGIVPVDPSRLLQTLETAVAAR